MNAYNKQITIARLVLMFILLYLSFRESGIFTTYILSTILIRFEIQDYLYHKGTYK